MGLKMILAVSTLALSTSAAFAQMAPAPGGLSTTPRSGAGAAAAPAVPAVNPLTSEDVARIDGTAVYDNQGSKIGSISTALMNPQNKTIDRLVVGVGGVLGIGSHRVAMPIDQFTWDQQKEGFTVAKSGADLKSMTEWQDPGARASGGSVAAPMPSQPMQSTDRDSSEPAH